MPEQIPVTEICAVTCNYARPNNCRACVRRLVELKIPEIIVWNNGAKPIEEATHNIICPENIGSIGRYFAAMATDKPYILIIDDDHLLTQDGLNSLCQWSNRYPVVVQTGYIFQPPFQDYRKRINVLSEQIMQPTPVDMLLPSRGLLLPTSIYRRIPHHWAWGSQKVLRPGFITTDLPVSCALKEITSHNPVVVPVKKRGAVKLEEEARDKALCYQPGSNEEKTKMLRWLIHNGWKMQMGKKPTPTTCLTAKKGETSKKASKTTS